MDGPDAHGIEYRCDPGRGQFCIVGQQGGKMRPIDFGARLDMAFDIVGVQLHQPRQNQVPAAIQSACRDAVPFSDVGNDARFDCDGPEGNAVWQNKLRIGKTQVC